MKSLIKHTINFLLIIFFMQSILSAQQSDEKHFNNSLHVSLPINSPENIENFEKNISNYSVQEEPDSFVMSKSPWTAVLLSAVVPGLGQIYNGSYLKAPIVWGIGAGLTAAWIFNNDRYWRYANLYAKSNFSGGNNYKSLRDFYRDQRDLITIYMGLAYFLNLVDAYVDAHLFDFTVEENLQINQTQLGLRVNF